jgi:hypothetical protein
MKVVRDNTIQSCCIFSLGCLKPLGFKFREKDLQLGNNLVSFVLILWPSWEPQHAQQNQNRRHPLTLHTSPNLTASHRFSPMFALSAIP